MSYGVLTFIVGCLGMYCIYRPKFRLTMAYSVLMAMITLVNIGFIFTPSNLAFYLGWISLLIYLIVTIFSFIYFKQLLDLRKAIDQVILTENVDSTF